MQDQQTPREIDEKLPVPVKHHLFVEPLPPFIRIHKRSDSLKTAREHASYPGSGVFAVVVDTTTGEEV